MDALRAILPPKKFTLLSVHSEKHKCRKLIFTRSSDKSTELRQFHTYVLCADGVAVLGLELVVYESIDGTVTLFVSKADTSGYYHIGENEVRLNIGKVIKELILYTLKLHCSVNTDIRICLFAKSMQQYLFLGSENNPKKHVLSDADLVKWWIRCLDSMSQISCKSAKLYIPGIDSRNLSKYFPTNSNFHWSKGDIFGTSEVDGANSELAVKTIPRFFDDPKTRFLDLIVENGRAKKVTHEQFLIELESQQEFRLGKSVGLIGLKGSISTDKIEAETVSLQDSDDFQKLIVSLDFENKIEAEKSTVKLLEFCEDFCRHELKGCAENTQNKKETVNKPKIDIQMLQPRKKRKT